APHQDPVDGKGRCGFHAHISSGRNFIGGTLNKVFGGELETIIQELNTAMAA
ncbi:MAG: hypothetical protein ISR62_02990, partial [Desulfobacteraceae bacterium]|nr:hypothetical protein [Desulfobacteraceae bacterium]